MADQPGLEGASHDIRNLSREDFEKIWQLWHDIFPTWPIERERMAKTLYFRPDHHYIHEHGFCLSLLEAGPQGKIAAVGVLPEYRRRGLGTALVRKAQAGLESSAREKGEELKSLEIGPAIVHFLPGLLVDFPQYVKDFFFHLGFQKASGPSLKDFYKDIRSTIAPPEILERVSKTNIKFTPWSPDLYEECVAKQKSLFGWYKVYEIIAAYDQYHEVMVAVDPDTNAQVGWTLMCSPSAIATQGFAYLPLLPAKEKTGLIAAVGVDKSARGKGVGLAFVVKAMENMRERGLEGVFVDSVVLQGFYEKMGFEPCWEYEIYTR